MCSPSPPPPHQPPPSSTPPPSALPQARAGAAVAPLTTARRGAAPWPPRPRGVGPQHSGPPQGVTGVTQDAIPRPSTREPEDFTSAPPTEALRSQASHAARARAPFPAAEGGQRHTPGPLGLFE